MEAATDVDKAAQPLVVAIDGPAGSGKSTVAKLVAEAAGLSYLDTGAMYRAATFAVLRRNEDPESAETAVRVLQECTIAQLDDGSVLVDGIDATAEIRSDIVSSQVSTVSSHAGVRRELVSRQREWIHQRGGGVLDGRDIATAVFPEALLKVFLTATRAVRAARRTKQSSGGEYNQVLADMKRRDKLDSERIHDPLRQADDAHFLDTSEMTIDEVVERIVDWLKVALDEPEETSGEAQPTNVEGS